MLGKVCRSDFRGGGVFGQAVENEDECRHPIAENSNGSRCEDMRPIAAIPLRQRQAMERVFVTSIRTRFSAVLSSFSLALQRRLVQPCHR